MKLGALLWSSIVVLEFCRCPGALSLPWSSAVALELCRCSEALPLFRSSAVAVKLGALLWRSELRCEGRSSAVSALKLGALRALAALTVPEIRSGGFFA